MKFVRSRCVKAFSLLLLLYYTTRLIDKTSTRSNGYSHGENGLIGMRAARAARVSDDITPDVVMPFSVDSYKKTFDCKTAVLVNVSFPVCLYSSKIDGIISTRLRHGKYYEGDNVKRFLRLLRLDRRLQLVDIGANIGVFSLPAARIAQVLAIEPNWRNMVGL